MPPTRVSKPLPQDGRVPAGAVPSRQPERAVVLLSGGMDSVTALYETHLRFAEVTALSFEYGSRHNHREIPCARWHAERLGVKHLVFQLPFVGQYFSSSLLRTGGPVPFGHYEEASMRQTVVPFRNGILLAVAAGLAESLEAHSLVIAAHAGDHTIYPDCREEFMRSMADAIRLGTYAGVRILRPFIDLDKAAILRRGHALGIDFAHTWSCYLGLDLHCGRCGTCVERREAFLASGLADPTAYADQSPLPPRPQDT